MTDREENLPPDNGPTPERARHDVLVEQDNPGKGRSYALKDKGLLEKYHVKGLLGHGRKENDRHYRAGEEYRNAAAAGMQRFPQSSLACPERIQQDPSAPADDHRLDASDKLTRAHNAIGPIASDCLLSVIHFEQSCHDWITTRHRQRGWAPPRRSVGIGHLREALWLLAKHWNIK